jgi:hypothetical protein
MHKFIQIDDTVRYNLDFIYKTEIVEGRVSEKTFSLGGGRKVWYVKFYSSISANEAWESEYFNSVAEANEWLTGFLEKSSK